MPHAGQLDARPTHRGAVPTAPRATARACYAIHRLVARNPLWVAVARAIEARPALYRVFTWAEERTKRATFGCRMCGQCALPLTGYACPMTCPKQLRNGPCGGVGDNGACEVYPELRCVWVQAYERASATGHQSDLELLQRPIDNRRFGESSWVNYWAGRDDYLAATGALKDPRPSLRRPASVDAA